MNSTFEVLKKSEWPRGNYISVATINLNPDYFKKKNGLEFFNSEEQIGPVQTAYLRLPSGLLVMLIYVEFTPDEGITFNLLESSEGTLNGYVEEVLISLDIDKKDITWQMGQSAWSELS